jgi:hypothetical protein
MAETAHTVPGAQSLSLVQPPPLVVHLPGQGQVMHLGIRHAFPGLHCMSEWHPGTQVFPPLQLAFPGSQTAPGPQSASLEQVPVLGTHLPGQEQFGQGPAVRAQSSPGLHCELE